MNTLAIGRNKLLFFFISAINKGVNYHKNYDKVLYMKKIFIILCACFALSGTLSAALPPLYRDANEIIAMLSDEKLGDFLQSGDSILEIKKFEHGYVIVTHDYAVVAHIIYEPLDMPGPAKPQVVFKIGC